VRGTERGAASADWLGASALSIRLWTFSAVFESPQRRAGRKSPSAGPSGSPQAATAPDLRRLARHHLPRHRLTHLPRRLHARRGHEPLRLHCREEHELRMTLGLAAPKDVWRWARGAGGAVAGSTPAWQANITFLGNGEAAGGSEKPFPSKTGLQSTVQMGVGWESSTRQAKL